MCNQVDSWSEWRTFIWDKAAMAQIEKRACAVLWLEIDWRVIFMSTLTHAVLSCSTAVTQWSCVAHSADGMFSLCNGRIYFFHPLCLFLSVKRRDECNGVSHPVELSCHAMKVVDILEEPLNWDPREQKINVRKHQVLRWSHLVYIIRIMNKWKLIHIQWFY